MGPTICLVSSQKANWDTVIWFVGGMLREDEDRHGVILVQAEEHEDTSDPQGWESWTSQSLSLRKAGWPHPAGGLSASRLTHSFEYQRTMTSLDNDPRPAHPSVLIHVFPSQQLSVLEGPCPHLYKHPSSAAKS